MSIRLKALAILAIDLAASLAILAVDAIGRRIEAAAPNDDDWAHDADDPSDSPIFDAVAKAMFREQLEDDELTGQYIDVFRDEAS